MAEIPLRSDESNIEPEFTNQRYWDEYGEKWRFYSPARQQLELLQSTRHNIVDREPELDAGIVETVRGLRAKMQDVEATVQHLGTKDEKITGILQSEIIDDGDGRRLIDRDEYVVKVAEVEPFADMVATHKQNVRRKLEAAGIAPDGMLDLINQTPYDIVIGTEGAPHTFERHRLLDVTVDGKDASITYLLNVEREREKGAWSPVMLSSESSSGNEISEQSEPGDSENSGANLALVDVPQVRQYKMALDGESDGRFLMGRYTGTLIAHRRPVEKTVSTDFIVRTTLPKEHLWVVTQETPEISL